MLFSMLYDTTPAHAGEGKNADIPGRSKDCLRGKYDMLAGRMVGVRVTQHLDNRLRRAILAKGGES